MRVGECGVRCVGFPRSRLSRATATPPTWGSGGEKRGLRVQNAVLSPCGLSNLFFSFRIRIPGHSFFFGSPVPHMMHHWLIRLASPRSTRYLGLPGCGRYHRAHFRSSRWSIRTDHLRWTEIRVRPIRLSLKLHYSLSTKCP